MIDAIKPSRKARIMGQIEFNEAQSRYEKDVDGHTVYATIRNKDGVLFIDYVYAPPELRGKGAAGEFMADLMDVAKREDLKVKPVCGYAASWLRRHEKEYADMSA